MRDYPTVTFNSVMFPTDVVKVLVTGGCGFIGSNFILTLFHRTGQHSCADLSNFHLEDLGEDFQLMNLDAMTYAANPDNLAPIEKLENYHFVKVDISDKKQVENAAGGFKPDFIVHFAAESHVDRSIESGDIFVKTNVLGTQVMLDFANRHNVKKFVHISTDEVYGSISEGSFNESDMLYTSNPYSASKGGSDLLAISHFETYGTPVTITRCTNNFGPGQHKEKLIPKIIHLVKKKKRIPIYGDGSNVRDWIYVKDHCTAITKVLESGVAGEIYNIAGRNEISNIEVVESVFGTMGIDNKSSESGVGYDLTSDRPGHDWRYSIDDSKLRYLGWKSIMSFQEGLEHTVNWYGGYE